MYWTVLYAFLQVHRISAVNHPPKRAVRESASDTCPAANEGSVQRRGGGRKRRDGMAGKHRVRRGDGGRGGRTTPSPKECCSGALLCRWVRVKTSHQGPPRFPFPLIRTPCSHTMLVHCPVLEAKRRGGAITTRRPLSTVITPTHHRRDSKNRGMSRGV